MQSHARCCIRYPYTKTPLFKLTIIIMKCKYIVFLVLLSLFSSYAKSQLITDFETDAKIKSISIYDCWEESPFRTGKLKGNFKIVDNPKKGVDEVTGLVHNGSQKVLGAQRSIHGSNMCGVRIDFKEPIILPTNALAIHINMLRPVDGKLMLVGLGRRLDWDDQPEDVEQFWVPSWTEVIANSWCDAVFRVWTTGNIALHSIVVIPLCESPHNDEEGFLYYIDNIYIDTSLNPRIATPQRYATAIDKTKLSTDSTSYLSSIDFESSVGTQTIEVGQEKTGAVYKYVEDAAIYAKPGEKIAVKPNYVGKSMHAYLYLDAQNNGNFEVPIRIGSTPAENKDLVAYSYYNGVNSAGESVSADSIALPAFTVPQDLAPGAYRMRLKLDWNSHKPEGYGSQSRFLAAGSYTDFMLFVGDSVATVSDVQLNGAVLTESGESLSSVKVPAYQPLTVKMSPAAGFRCEGLKVTSGFNISSTSNKDRHGNVKYLTMESPIDTEYFTIPAQYIVGDVRIEGKMVEVKDDNGGSGANEIADSQSDGIGIKIVKDGIVLHSEKPVDIQICDPSGTIIYSRKSFKGEERVSLQPGIYLINDKKIIV